MAEVLLDHITKVYPNGVTAVSDLSLRVADGELAVIVGPSGCGKTTTLRLIAGLEKPTDGSIHIDRKCVTTLPSRDRDVAMVFQRSTLYPHLSVRRNLSFGLEMRSGKGVRPPRITGSDPFSRGLVGLHKLFCFLLAPLRSSQFPAPNKGSDPLNSGRQTPYSVEERVTQAAELLGLEGVLERRPGELSGGQQQRVALGRALVRQPGVFLLDEPLSHLDGRLRAELRHELHLLQRHLRATMIYVTHDQAEAMTLADRIIVMDQGVVQQVGASLEVYQRPHNRFVAEFVGWPPMNFVDGRLAEVGGRLCFTVEKGSDPLNSGGQTPFPGVLPVPAGKMSVWAAFAGRSVSLGIRPEGIRLNQGGPDEAMLPMQVVLVEALGHENLVTFQYKGWQATARVPNLGGLTPYSAKQDVEVFFDMANAHLFDGSTRLTLDDGRPAG